MSLHASGLVRVITDPELKSFESGSSVVRFYGGLNEGKDKNGDYIKNGIEVEVWNKSGEVILNYAPKGSSVLISGNVLKQEWTDKETGKLQSKHVLRANRVELLPRSSEENRAPASNSGLFEGSQSAADLDDEIPF